MPIATTITTKFLIIYWPSSVGMNQFCHATPGNSANGAMTITMCSNNSRITIRVAFGIKNSIPITHSITAKTANRIPKYSSPTVCPTIALASGSAGLTPKNFKNPNQKKTIKSATRAAHRNEYCERPIMRRSSFCNFCFTVLNKRLRLEFL